MYSFLFNNLRFQIAATVFLLIIEIIYFIRPKLRLLSSRFFSLLMISVIIYLIFDYASAICLIYLNKVPRWLLRFTHQGFIFFLQSTLSLIYLYTDLYNRNQKRYSKFKISFIACLYIFSIFFVIFAPMEYVLEPDGIYSYGAMADFVYLIIVLYMILITKNAIVSYKKGINKKEQLYIFATMGLWTIFGFIQMLVPKMLISSVGLTAVILLLFLSLENPSEYIDKETLAFNSTALKLMLGEYLNRRKPFYVINIDLEDLDILENQLGQDVRVNLLTDIRIYLVKTFRLKIYRFTNQSVTFILARRYYFRKEEILEKIQKRFENVWSIGETNVMLNAHLDVITCPTDFPYDGLISELLTFIQESHSYSTSKTFVRAVDSEIKENYERKKNLLLFLRQAIENKEFEMYYQPIFNVKENKFTNVEALVRLKNITQYGFVSPEEFIPMVEKNGMIMDLSNIIFNKVFSFMNEKSLRQKGISHMELNLSGLQSVDSDLPLLMNKLLTEYNIPADSVNLEITESVAITSGYMLKKNMDELKKMGCSFSMDDFGTGYSNLSQIVKTEFEVIKIDKSLLWPCFDEKNKSLQNAKMLLETLIELMLKFGYEIVVEGIETQEQFEYLKKQGITFAQGYYFSKPLCENDFIEFLEKNNK